VQDALPAAYSNEAALGLNESGNMSVAHQRLQETLAGLQGTLDAGHAAFLKVRLGFSFNQHMLPPTVPAGCNIVPQQPRCSFNKKIAVKPHACLGQP
jgi:hypothetical protein